MITRKGGRPKGRPFSQTYFICKNCIILKPCFRVLHTPDGILLLPPISARTAERPFPMDVSTRRKSRDNPPRQDADTLETRVTEQNQRLYDSIASKTRRRAVPAALPAAPYAIAQTRRERSTTRLICWPLRRQSHQRHPHRTRTTFRIGLAAGSNEPANKLHVLTRENIIRRDLLFKVGERFDPNWSCAANNCSCRRSYISDTDISVTIDPLDTMRVDIVLHTATAGRSVSMQPSVPKNDDGGPDRRKHPRNRYPIHSRKQFQPQRTSPTAAMSWDTKCRTCSVRSFTFEVEAVPNFFEDILLLRLRKEFLKADGLQKSA